MASVLHTSKIDLSFENKKQLICIRVCGKSITSAQADGDR